MKDKTNGFSFVLKPSVEVPGGVGVFAVHDIAKDTHMELFLPDFQEVVYNKDEIPEILQGYCLDQEGGKILCPKFFNRMDIGNYINHSPNQNLRFEEEGGYFALRDIKAGEELLADYKELGEPENTWGGYYTGEGMR